jgi:hypothetical protein
MKIRQSLIILFCLSFLQQSISQNALPPAFDILTDTIGTLLLPATHWQYIEDRAAIWTIDSVRESYVYFALYIFFLGFTRFLLPLFHLFFREDPSVFSPLFYPFCHAFIIFFNTYFFRNLLKTYIYYPIWDKILLVSNAVTLVLSWFTRQRQIFHCRF